MIKYVPEDTSVCFAEIKLEISLGLNLSCCPHRCPGCHSSYLQKDIGEELTTDVIDDLINKNQGITCILFLGGDNDKLTLVRLAKHITDNYDLLVGWYSGESELDLNEYGRYFDYIKVGPYIESLGPLNSPTTNQRLYYINKSNSDKIISEDITYTLQHRRI
jgi:anaerobic ribonucleoside-triphosphate reductase activating protein